MSTLGKILNGIIAFAVFLFIARLLYGLIASLRSRRYLQLIHNTVSPLPDEAREKVLEEIHSEFGVRHLMTPSLSKADEYYGIHDSDLGLLREVVVVAAAIYAALQNPVAVIGGLVVLLYKFRHKCAKLSAVEALVLSMLKKNRPKDLSVQELNEILPLKKQMTNSELTEILNGLRDVKLNDGTTTAFVNQKDGRWWSVDI
jgi:hypothetical protein